MQRKARTRAGLIRSLAACAGLALPLAVAMAQDEAAAPQGQPDAPAQPAAVPAQPAPTQPEAPPPASAPVAAAGVTFNFKDAAIDQVLDFFARQTGVPIIYEAAAPQGTITFVSPTAYTVQDALSILNLNLQRFGVHLRRQDQYLYLATTQDSMKKPSPVVSVDELENATPDTIVTVNIPLDNARAELVAEQIRPMVGGFGGVFAAPVQNMVVIVETAAQVRRIREVVRAIDSVRPVDSAFRLFPLKHAQSDAVLAALRGLVGERVTTVIVDKDGQKRTIQEQQVTGVQLAADPRTNAIVAVGTEGRIRTVEELITLLDVPESAGDVRMATFVLSSITPEAAAAQVNMLYAGLEPRRRPTVIALPDTGRLSVVGPANLLAQAEDLLRQADPSMGGQGGARQERQSATVALEHVSATQAEQLLAKILGPTRGLLRYTASPDGRSLIILGNDADVRMISGLVEAIDSPATGKRDVRLIRLDTTTDATTLEAAKSLHDKTADTPAMAVEISVDSEMGVATVVGTPEALAKYDDVLRTVRTSLAGAVETRMFTLGSIAPSSAAAKLARLAPAMLSTTDTPAPQFEAMDEMRVLIVRAAASQFGVIKGLIEQVDTPDVRGREVRIVRLSGADPKAALERATTLYAERSKGRSAEEAGPISTEIDDVSGSVVVSGSARGVAMFMETLAQVQQLSPPERRTRVLDVKNIAAGKAIEELAELLKEAEPTDPARRVPPPVLRVIERTNSILVTAEEPQHGVVAELLSRIDQLESGTPPALKLLQVRSAEAPAIAAMLVEQYNRRPQADRAAKPVDVRADAATNTLIISAHPDLYEEIRDFVEEINRDRATAKRVTEIFPLKVAKAVDVAAALDRLYPEPPIPTDRLGRPQPWLKQPREVQVSAEPQSNAIIIDAPAERMEALRELAAKLDRVEMPVRAALRTYHVKGASLDAVAATLRSMAQRGILSEPAQTGKQPVQVLIEVEPKSATLIVAGDDHTFSTVEQVLSDLALAPVEKSLRIFPIANEKAAKVRDRAVEIYEAQVSQIPDANPVEVTIDETSNSIMLVADKDAMDRFTKVMDELQRQAGPAREVRLIEMRLARAEEVVEFLSDMVASSETMMIRGGPEPVIEAIESTNSIMVAAQPGQMAVIEALARSLDARQSAEKPPMRILKLRSTDAQNMATVLQREYDRRPMEQRGKQPVSIDADPGTNTLIVSAHSDLLPEIEAIVDELNETDATGGEGREIRIFPLRVARAEELAITIDQMFPEPQMPLDPRTRQPRPDLRPPREVVVRADRATNSLIVDAPAKRLAGFEQIVKSLDQAQMSEDLRVRTYRLTRADVNTLAATLRTLASSGSLGNAGQSARAPVTISSEPGTRTLIVSGPESIFTHVEEVVKRVDSWIETSSELKMYPLSRARAERMQPLVERVLSGRAREAARAAGTPVPEEVSLVEVTADSPSNTLLVTASREILVVADGLIKSLDSESVAGGTEVRIFRMQRGSAESAATAVLQAVRAQGTPGEPEVSVTPETASNTLVVVGTRSQIERAETLVNSLDVAADKDGVGVRTIILTNGRAEALAPVLEGVLARESTLDRLPEWARIQAISRGAEERPRVRVAADSRTNAIVVSGPTALLDLAEQIVQSLDKAEASDGSQRQLRVITLRNAEASQLATNIAAVFEEEASKAAAPTVRVDAVSNSLIVRASAEQMATIEELAGTLDKAAGISTRQMRMVPVDRSRVDAEVLARTLRRMSEQRGGAKIEVLTTDELLRRQLQRSKDENGDDPDQPPPSGSGGAPAKKQSMNSPVQGPLGGSRGVTTIGKSDSPRGLAAAGHDWRLAALGAMVMTAVIVESPEAFAQAAEAEATATSPRPAHAEEQSTAAAPEAVVTAKPHVAQPPTVKPVVNEDEEDDDRITIAVDPGTNSLLLIGSPRQTERLALLAEQLQREMPAEPVGVRVISLPRGVEAGGIAALLQQTIQQVGRAGAAGGGFTGPVNVLADPAGGALIVMCNDTDFDSVGMLITSIAQLDNAREVSVKVYPLENITAQRAMLALRDLFADEPRGAQARRTRLLDVVIGGEEPARIDPASVRAVADPSGRSLIVAAPSDAMAMLDRFIETLDQTPTRDRMAIRRYSFTYARSADMARTLQSAFDAQRQFAGATETPAPRFVAEERTNSLLVAATSSQHEDVARLLETSDSSVEDPTQETAVFTLQQATPSTIQRAIDEVMIGRDAAKKDRLRISAQDGSSLLIVRAPKEEMDRIRSLISQIDAAETSGLPVRSVKLERADAAVVAAALQRFFTERANASSRPGQRVTNRVAVAGDKRTGTVLVAASDEDFEQVKSLVATFDSPTPVQDFQFRIVALKNAKVTELGEPLRNIVDEVRWTSVWGGGRGAQGGDDQHLFLEINESTNSIILIGRGEQMDVVEGLISAMDQPPSDRADTIIKSVEVRTADLAALRTVLERAFSTPGWRPWRGPDPAGVMVQIDRQRRALILAGKAESVEKAVSYIAQLDTADSGEARVIEAITLSHARADRVATNLRQFFADRARAQGLDAPPINLVGSADGNVLIVAGPKSELGTVNDLVAQIDQPEAGKDRRIEVFVLQNATARDAADVLRTMYGQRDAGQERVIVTPQPSTNSVILSASAASFDEIAALLRQIDAPPRAEDVNIETVPLATARAQDVAQAVRAALPPNVKVTVTPVARSNSLMLTGSREAIALVMEQVRKIDQEPVRSGLVFRRYRLKAADAMDVASTVRQVLRARPRIPNEPDSAVDYSLQDNAITLYAPADQIEEVEKIIAELDTPAGVDRTTEFVKLEYANAEQTATALRVFYGRYAMEAATPAARTVTVLPDPLSNSLVIRADAGEWQGIRALLEKLDTKEYDTRRRLAVIPLTYADATGIARALNEGFRAPLEQAQRQQAALAQRQQADRRASGMTEATALAEVEAPPTISAESITNSLIIFAAARDMERITEVVKQLDVAGFANMPAARIIPLRTGKPSTVAATLRDMFMARPERGPGAGPAGVTGPRSVVIVGDDASGSLIVRADEEKFLQIKVLAEALQEQGSSGRILPHVIRLKNVPAGRLRQTLLTTFSETARQLGETIAIEIDRGSNSLVVACSERLLVEITRVVRELDSLPFGEEGADAQGAAGPLGGLGQSVTIIDVINNSPIDIKRTLDEMGVSRPQAADRPGVVSEPVTIVTLSSRRSIAVIGGPADARTIESLVKAIDAAPVDSTQTMAFIPLRMASAGPLVQTLTSMLRTSTEQAVDTGPARALAEHVRRLGISRAGLDQPAAAFDLSKPIRLVADVEANALVVSSTPANIEAVREVVKLLDTLPIGDAVIVRIFTLSNASSTRVKQVVDQLFSQGEALRRLPGTRRQGLPPTATGQALAGDIAVTVDDRTNTLIVAGREEAVALVEVLVKDLDSDRAANWIEPLILPMKHADATVLARKLQEVLVRGLTLSPDAMGLQKQFGRLRMSIDGAPVNPADKNNTVQADLFAPVTGLVISADEQLNALIVIGTPANLKVVTALAGMLDVEAASASNTVRIFPLKNAAADRVTTMLRDVFRQRETLPDQRPEDRLVVTPDARTNSLVVTTSPRTFAVLEGMITTLDSEQSNFSVGLHVIPVAHVDVRQLAPRIERLMRERLAAAAQSGGIRSPMDAFSIEAEPVSNLLIVACSEENLQIVRELVAALTADSAKLAAGERVDIVQLTKARAAEIAVSLNELYISREVQRRGPGAVSVTPNERLNSLVISGNEQDMIELRALAKRLDSAEVAARQQIRWIELKSANATEVVNLVESVIAGRPVGGGRGVGARQATRLMFLRDRVVGDIVDQIGRPPTEAEIDGAIRDQVTLTADPRTNSIWITAPDPMVALISEMIEDIERSSAGARKIERFTLVNADARQMADLLRDTFRLEQRGNAMVLLPAGQRRMDSADQATDAPGDTSLAGTSVTAVPDERQQLSIAVDLRTNTLIVSGTDEYLSLVRQIVNEIDSIQANDRERRVYNLRNAKAKEIETTLRSYFRGEVDTERSTLGPQLTGSLMRRLEQEVTVVGDEKSNKLVISTSPRYMSTVLGIVQELDTPPPQVMIQVLLAEVTIDNSQQWGMDFNIGPIGGDAARIGFLGAGSGVATALGVPNLSVTSADFGILVRALEAQGKLEVLSNPQVTVNNNQPAEINVGDEIGVAGSTERSNVGTLISSVERIPVGIIMNVTPSISDDGYVRMEISPSISQLTNRTTQINRDQNAPVISKRSVDTVVTVKDGQSIVIGGLIQTTMESRRTKVPIIGDIPLIGLPFRSKQDEARKTELLVIVTPRIIPGLNGTSETTVGTITDQTIDRMEDPTRVLDYLERIREDVKNLRQKSAPPTDPSLDWPWPTEQPSPVNPGEPSGGPVVTEERSHSVRISPAPQAPPATTTPPPPRREPKGPMP
jgi:type II secretion system protein D